MLYMLYALCRQEDEARLGERIVHGERDGRKQESREVLGKVVREGEGGDR